MPETSVLTKIEEETLNNMMSEFSKETANALSAMINKKVELSSASSKITLINDIPRLLNPEGSATTMIFTKLSGGIRCVVVLSSTLKNITKLANLLLHKPEGYFEKLGTENTSAIKELADILIGYYITGLNHALNAEYHSTMPIISLNPVRSIEEFGFGPIYTEQIHVLMLKASFSIPEENIKKEMTIIFKKESLERLFEKLMKSESKKKQPVEM